MSYTGQDISLYTDKYTSFFSQPEHIESRSAIPEPHQALISLDSIDSSSSMETVAAPLRTKDAELLTWDVFATMLTDEYNYCFILQGKINKDKYKLNQNHKNYHSRFTLVGGDISYEANKVGNMVLALSTVFD